MTTRTLLLATLGFILLSFTSRAETYTYPQLVKRMTDMRELAKLPPAGEKTSLASSYDRASKYDPATDKYTGWSANSDGGGIVRQEGDESVLMDVTGPGCIWRTWSATASSGHVKIYLDGATTPTVDLPFTGYFDGKTAPFNRPNIVYIPSQAAHGFDNYTPMPFQKSCKIVADKGWGAYYQFTYTQFPEGTVVPTFSMNLSAEDSAALDQADKILGACGQMPADAETSKTVSKSITVDGGSSATVADLHGEGAITALKVKLDLPQDADAQRILLRNLTISITWDGEDSPAVWSPLGDYFAYIGGADTFQSLPVGLLPDGTFYSYWYMPYASKAHIVVGNDGSTPVAMTWEISHSPLQQPISKLARFHAKWHRDAFLTTRQDRWPDWTLLTTTGTGRYVGTHLHIWNPRGGWWGEGDDKFFVDGEKFPSTFGTGSEDYFGYAWSSSGHFSRAYHNQILNENNAGHEDDNRFHIADSVPFQTSLEANIEKYFPNSRPTLFAAEVFWYLNAGGMDPYKPLPVTDRVGYWTKPVNPKVQGAIEGESLQLVTPVNGVGNQDMSQFGEGWSDNQQLFWQASQAGDTLSLALPAQKAGTYKLIAAYTNANDYGIAQASLNGTDIGGPTDLFGPAIVPAKPIDLGTVALTGDKSVLKFTITGKNPSSQGYRFGLDYIKLVPAP
jgi:hypothetical protein